METKYKVILIVVSLVTAFAVGRYSAQKPSSKLQESVVTDTNQSKDQDTIKKTTIEKHPDGVETTTIVEETKTNTIRNTDQSLSLDKTVTAPKINTLNISVLGGVDFSEAPKTVYGLSVTKDIIGPVSIGVFGLTNSTVGASIGLSF